MQFKITCVLHIIRLDPPRLLIGQFETLIVIVVSIVGYSFNNDVKSLGTGGW